MHHPPSADLMDDLRLASVDLYSFNKADLEALLKRALLEIERLRKPADATELREGKREMPS